MELEVSKSGATVGGEVEEDTKEGGNSEMGGHVCGVRGMDEGAESLKGALVTPNLAACICEPMR
jgi:hypothetical protein